MDLDGDFEKGDIGEMIHEDPLGFHIRLTLERHGQRGGRTTGNMSIGQNPAALFIHEEACGVCRISAVLVQPDTAGALDFDHVARLT